MANFDVHCLALPSFFEFINHDKVNYVVKIVAYFCRNAAYTVHVYST